MAEYIDDSQIEVELTVKISMDYDEYYLTPDAARKLRDELSLFLDRV